jgi:hypothetical protein
VVLSCGGGTGLAHSDAGDAAADAAVERGDAASTAIGTLQTWNLDLVPLNSYPAAIAYADS